MSHQLDGIRAKIERANEHLDTLDHEFGVFFEPYTQRPILNHRHDGTWHVISLNPILDGPVPPRLGVICGDAIHDLRSALDHLVWQLVVAEGKRRPGWWTNFPILDHPNSFKSSVRFPKPGKRPSPLQGITPDGVAWKLIENEQPYKRPPVQEHYLTILAKLSNVDKHRTIISQLLFPTADSIRDAVGWNPAARLLEHRSRNGPLSPESKTEVLRLRFADEGPDPQVHVKGAVGIVPSFGDGGTFQVSRGGVKQLPVWIGRLVEQFVEFV